MNRLRASIITIAAAAALGGAAAGPAHAAFPGENGRLAFSTNADGNFEIYSSNPDGTDRRRLTTFAGDEFEPQWSPDGNRLAFARRDSDGYNIYTMNADGSDARKLTAITNPYLTNQANRAPTWSPDGMTIAYEHVSDQEGYDVWTMNATDGSSKRMLSGIAMASARAPKWSPDGTKLAMTSGTEIYTLGADGRNPVRIATGQAPDWSPDGTQLAFTAKQGSTYIAVVNADGTGQRGLGNYGHTPSWSPDGRKITFTGGPGTQVFVMNADGSGATNVSNRPAMEYSSAWGPGRNVTNIVILGPSSVTNGQPATLQARLRRGTTPIAGKTLVLMLGSGALTQYCSGQTNSLGRAECTIPSANQSTSATQVALWANFSGDAQYAPSSMGAYVPMSQ